MSFERRLALVELLFEHYGATLPSGEPLPARDRWPKGWAEAMADTPPVRDLDRKIEYGMRAMNESTARLWQAHMRRN